MKITLWGDFACPFCYIGETMLENVLEQLRAAGAVPSGGVTVEFRAYELDPEAPSVPVETMTQHFVKTHDVTEEDAVSQMERITRMASRNGLDYRLSTVKVCSTFDAHRLMKYAIANAGPETVSKLNFALFKANFTDNLLLSDHSVLTGIATGVGLDRPGVERLLASDEYSAEVRNDEKEADGRNLEYIPYLLFDNGAVLQGILSPGLIRKTILG